MNSTIDKTLEHVWFLARHLKKYNIRGAVIVMNPRTGEILAYAVYPFFDPNNFKTATSFQTKSVKRFWIALFS